MISLILALTISASTPHKTNPPKPTITVQQTTPAPTPAPVEPAPEPEPIQTPPAPINVVSYNNDYSPGFCTWGVANWISVPSSLGNANAWDDTAAYMGFTVSPIPKVNAVAQTDFGWAGHVALVEAVADGQVLIKEMNYNGLYSVDERWTPVSDWLYIYF